MFIRKIFYRFCFLYFLFTVTLSAQTAWYEKESEHFKVIYKANQAFLVPNVINSAESALQKLMKIFNYTPSEKIVISLYDASDYGFASATSVPENFIRLEIEPFEHAYENIPYNERIRWVISHELVHVVVDDHASDIESITRSIFSKVSPEQNQPITTFYSLLTNYSRFTPRWHQEGIAVFLETWLSGGFGRVLGNFDEMFFRSMVKDSIRFPSYNELDAKTTLTSFLLGTLYYIYGERFCTYLSIKYGADKLIQWFREEPTDFYGGFVNKFERVYGFDFDRAWDDFINYEKDFQKENIKRIESSPLSPVRRLREEPIGWVTEPYFNPSDSSLIFGYHTPNHLAGIQKFYLTNNKSDKLGTLPTPSMFRVASTAFDKSNGLFFYTTKNNELYRDLDVLETSTGDTKVLFENSRMGDITVSPATHELWGVSHEDAQVSLMYSRYPYRNLVPIIKFNYDDEIYDLSVSPSGNYLAAILHRASGEQSLIIVSCDSIKAGKPFKYETIYSQGSPECPSWSSDEKYLLWNAYTNGVSNIYRQSRSNGNIEPLSNTVDGLFHPVFVSSDSIFAFEFTANGFRPVMIPNKIADRLPAIKYFGEEVVEKNPQVTKWTLNINDDPDSVKNIPQENYNPFDNLKVLTFVPVITGFQDTKVLGFYTHISDPLIMHDLTMEFGVSVARKTTAIPLYHFRGKYEYQKQLVVALDYNATDFYDLFNNRKRGLIGTKLNLGYTHYWIFDNPLKVMQKFAIDYYTNTSYINDNLVRVSQPDFSVAQTSINSKELRKSIGSIDFEEGNEFNATLMVFGTKTYKTLIAEELYGEWDHYLMWIWPHNVFHFKLAAGYSNNTDEEVQAKFYFGGFGNRAVENVDVKQYRGVFRLPGIPIYSLAAESFTKLMLENELPALRFSDASIGQHYLSHISLSFFTEGLALHSRQQKEWINLGSQINFVFRHWFNLESTLSAGAAKAWYKGGNSVEWFISYKLLRN